jgi:hypothetical protein
VRDIEVARCQIEWLIRAVGMLGAWSGHQVVTTKTCGWKDRPSPTPRRFSGADLAVSEVARPGPARQERLLRRGQIDRGPFDRGPVRPAVARLAVARLAIAELVVAELVVAELVVASAR